MTSLCPGVTLGEAIDQVFSQLHMAKLAYGHGVETAEEEAAWLVLYLCGEELGQEDYPWDRNLTDKEISGIQQALGQRIAHRKPLAYLFNEAWFAGYAFYVDERVLVPRSFFAEWIDDRFEPWIDASKVTNILDLCCGSGCIGIAAALAFDSATVTLSDISSDALTVARKNVERYQLEHRVAVNCGDGFSGLDQKYDLILCNPPYVSDQRMDKLPPEYLSEPDLALRAGGDGLDFIRPLLQQARRFLTDDGVLIVEAGSASLSFEQAWPSVPFTWLGTEYDEMVLFLLTTSELDKYHHVFAETASPPKY